MTIAGQQASALWKKGPQSYGFRGTAQLNLGPNTVQIEATDGNGSPPNPPGTLSVNVQTAGTAILSMTYDDNGNLLTASGRTYTWDAANRLLSITYPDSTKTEFQYNGSGQRTRIVEKTSAGAITEDRRFVWCGMTLREERNAGNQVLKRFETQGVRHVVPGSPGLDQNYFYTRDHLGSVRDVIDSTKKALTRASYDPWGRKKELSREHVSTGLGYRQHYFTGATKTMAVAAGDKLFAYVYLDPQNLPSEIMLQWNVGGSWEQRAYWGQNLIGYGTDGTNSRRRIGNIPTVTTAGWVRLEVAASQVGMEGQTASGMSFDVYNGTAKWDRTGRANTSGSEETTWFGDAIPAGATPTSNWSWVAASTGPKADFGYTGHFFHQKSGLHLAYYRAYDAELGRWLNRDPIEEDGGLNLYGYVRNKPLTEIDPAGLIWLNVAGGIAGAVGGAAAEFFRQTMIGNRTPDWGSIGTAALAGGVGGALSPASGLATAALGIGAAAAAGGLGGAMQNTFGWNTATGQPNPPLGMKLCDDENDPLDSDGDGTPDKDDPDDDNDGILDVYDTTRTPNDR